MHTTPTTAQAERSATEWTTLHTLSSVGYALHVQVADTWATDGYRVVLDAYGPRGATQPEVLAAGLSQPDALALAANRMLRDLELETGQDEGRLAVL